MMTEWETSQMTQRPASRVRPERAADRQGVLSSPRTPMEMQPLTMTRHIFTMRSAWLERETVHNPSLSSFPLC